jgi:O-antigen ligase
LSSDRRAAYHNDFILFLAEGGVLGAGLLVAWMLLVLVSLTRRYFNFVRSHEPEHAKMARLVLVGLNGFFVSMAFNPVLEGLSRSATIFALVAIASTLGSPEDDRGGAHLNDDILVPALARADQSPPPRR